MTWLARLSLLNRAVVALLTLLVLGFGLIATGARCARSCSPHWTFPA